MIYHYLPQVKSIGGYARVDNLKNKTVEQVRQLKDAGYNYSTSVWKAATINCSTV